MSALQYHAAVAIETKLLNVDLVGPAGELISL